MSNTVINVTQIRDNLAEVLGRVKFGEEVVTVEKKDKPYAVIMSPQ
jgi:prevent-host-death family protein